MKPESHRAEEYNDARDMSAFWKVARSLKKEPVKQKWFIPILIICIVISVPWYLTPGESGSIIGGLPSWVWVSLGCSLGISILTSIGALIFWKESDDE
jgi:hypothetical protein